MLFGNHGAPRGGRVDRAEEEAVLGYVYKTQKQKRHETPRPKLDVSPWINMRALELELLKDPEHNMTYTTFRAFFNNHILPFLGSVPGVVFGVLTVAAPHTCDTSSSAISREGVAHLSAFRIFESGYGYREKQEYSCHGTAKNTKICSLS